MNSSPNESHDLLWYEQAVNAAAHIGAMAYGIHIAVFYKCITTILRDKERRHWKWIPFVGILFALGTINIASSINFNQLAWIDDRDYPGGPAAFLLEQPDRAPNVSAIATAIIILVLSDTLMIFRCHALWKKIYITVILAVVFVASVVISTIHFIQITRPTTVLNDPSKLNFSVPFASLVTSLHILITLVLLSRLVDLRRRLPSTMHAAVKARYTSIEALIVESAFPIGLFSLVFVILYSIGNPGSVIVFPLLVQTLGIMPILIIMRIIGGHAWSSDSTRAVGPGATMLRGQLGRLENVPGTNELSVISMPNGSNPSLDLKGNFV